MVFVRVPYRCNPPQRGGGLNLGFLRNISNIFSKGNLKENLKKGLKHGAQKLLEFGSNVLKTANSNPNIGILDAAKSTAASEIKKSFRNLMENKKSINNAAPSMKKVSVSRKRKHKVSPSKINKAKRKITL